MMLLQKEERLPFEHSVSSQSVFPARSTVFPMNMSHLKVFEAAQKHVPTADINAGAIAQLIEAGSPEEH